MRHGTVARFVLQGAVNNDEGRVNQAVLQIDVHDLGDCKLHSN